MSDKNYTDTEGRPVSLGSLCRSDPDWAESRIRYMEMELEQLGGKLAVAVEERTDAYGALVELKENGFLECVIEPACGDCIVCRARKVQSEEKPEQSK